jgi:ribosomal protein S27AE
MSRPDLDATWQQLTAEVLSGFREWRERHPTATLSEIETALDERWARARARLVEDAALLSAAADLRATAARPACPECGERMQADGQEVRRLTTVGGQALTLRRSRARCPACGAGLFPPR